MAVPGFLDRYDLFVFDLDGTLADTREDLAASLNHALERLGRPRCDLETVTRFIGNGAQVLIRRALGAEAPAELAAEGLASFLSHYGAHCLDRSRLYPGVREVLEKLSAAGKALTVLTNKPTALSIKILSALGVAGRFLRIDGGDRFPSKKPDPEGLKEAMGSSGHGGARTILIGDSAVDVETARAAGARAAGALWGFKPDELLADPPEHLVREPSELLGPAPLSAPVARSIP